jgi:hypothetical protein
MKHINTSVPRDCGIRYGALSLALLFACPALAYTGEKLAKDAKVSIGRSARHRSEGASGQDHGRGIGT